MAQRLEDATETRPLMAELQAAGVIQRTMFNSIDDSAEESVTAVFLHTTELNLRRPMEAVQQAHKDLLVRP